jgi:hypothetical protein
MKYEELGSDQKMHINGVISKFMDEFIRNNLIWTPEQMYVAFYKKIDAEHRNGWYGSKQMVNGKWVSPYYKGNFWLTTNDAKDYIMKKFETKYDKNTKLARKASPLVERARFGLKWNHQLFYDISWGLKNYYDFEKTDIVEKNNMIPWSITHIEHELQTKYGKTIKDVLLELSKSPTEKMFYEGWFSLYYHDKRNPALIPEFCGTRRMFYCYKDVNGRYSLEQTKDCYTVNVRYDFAVINYNKQKMLFLELDGHDYHKTKDQRINDSIKRTIATNEGWQMNVVTGTQIYQNVHRVFDSMKGYFCYE